MDAQYLIENRRSTRVFDDREIESGTLDRLRRLTLRAPSAGNKILWSVIEVDDMSKKKALADCCDNQQMIASAPGVWLFLADSQRWYDYFVLDKCSEKNGDEKLRKPGIGDFHLSMQDAIIAAQNAVIAIESLGMSSCYIGDVIENYETIQEMFDLPPYACPAAMIIFGYPKFTPKSPMTLRPEPEYVFYKDSYRTLAEEEHRKMFLEQKEELRKRKSLPYGNKGSFADYYYRKKYISEFMKEMNRSAGVFIRRWCEG